MIAAEKKGCYKQELYLCCGCCKCLEIIILFISADRFPGAACVYQLSSSVQSGAETMDADLFRCTVGCLPMDFPS